MNQPVAKTQRTGIRDWQAKQALLRALYDVLNSKALVQAVVEGWITKDYDLPDAVERCYDTFRRWDQSKPAGQGSQRFWGQIIEDKKLRVGMAHLWSSSIVEFVDAFKDIEGIRAAVGELVADTRAPLDCETKEQLQRQFGIGADVVNPVQPARTDESYLMRGHWRMTFEGPHTGVQNGHIQSTQFYNLPEAAKAWAAMVDSENYRMYLECLLSLKQLVETGQWEQAVGTGVYDAAVTLGGGASPEKDWVLATSLSSARAQQHAPLTYILNDISPYMIQHSVRFLHRRLAKSQLEHRIKVEYDWSDVLKLDVLFQRPACRSVVWAILGGTIGNVSELNFFRSINGPSRVGDLLVVGLDTIDSETDAEFEERMSSEYRSRELDALLLAPIQIATAKLGTGQPVVDVTVQTYEDGNDSNLSEVPHSRTAVFSIPSDAQRDGRTILAYSTRYSLEECLNYARKFGWTHVATAAPQESTFRQVLLQRAT